MNIVRGGTPGSSKTLSARDLTIFSNPLWLTPQKKCLMNKTSTRRAAVSPEYRDLNVCFLPCTSRTGSSAHFSKSVLVGRFFDTLISPLHIPSGDDESVVAGAAAGVLSVPFESPMIIAKAERRAMRLRKK